MKRCPKCNAEYFDNILEFCLEDGTRLASAPKPTASASRSGDTARPAGVHDPLAKPDSEETIVMARPAEAGDEAFPLPPGSRSANKLIETAPIVLALLHNWWQWIYLEKTYVYSITAFVTSANFLMWLLLLAAGTTTGVYSVKYSKDKTLGIISLVALGINLILFLVPRR